VDLQDRLPVEELTCEKQVNPGARLEPRTRDLEIPGLVLWTTPE
jgi:hypothetical protein